MPSVRGELANESQVWSEEETEMEKAKETDNKENGGGPNRED